MSSTPIIPTTLKLTKGNAVSDSPWCTILFSSSGLNDNLFKELVVLQWLPGLDYGLTAVKMSFGINVYAPFKADHLFHHLFQSLKRG